MVIAVSGPVLTTTILTSRGGEDSCNFSSHRASSPHPYISYGLDRTGRFRQGGCVTGEGHRDLRGKKSQLRGLSRPTSCALCKYIAHIFHGSFPVSCCQVTMLKLCSETCLRGEAWPHSPLLQEAPCACTRIWPEAESSPYISTSSAAEQA